MTRILKKTLSIIANLIFVIILIFSLTIGFFFVKSKIQGTTPNVAGYKIYAVLTGSMVPVFNPGSIVIDKEIKPENIAPKDIITFKDPRDSTKLISHRVMEVNQDKNGLSFVTKGDANDSKDPFKVPAANVIGKVNYSVPGVGYVVEFARSPQGIKYLIIIPALIFIFTQLLNVIKIFKEDKKLKLEAKNEEIPS